MSIKPLDRLLFAQGNRCFFCSEPLDRSDASIEHLVALANSGANADDNCVACCKALNRLLDSMPLKDKVKVVLNQEGKFKCPNGHAPAWQERQKTKTEKLAVVIQDLTNRKKSKPKTIKTLSSTIASLFQPRLSDKETESIVHSLRSAEKIFLTGSQITYTF